MYRSISFQLATSLNDEKMLQRCSKCHEQASDQDYELVYCLTNVNGICQRTYILKKCYTCKKYIILKKGLDIKEFHQQLVIDL
jgi:hypothetical protein